MKISIIGYSGAGKSTLAQNLSKFYNADVLHFDSVHFLSDWKIRNEDEKLKITTDFFKFSFILGNRR